jgi:hypothetical protein
VGIQHPLVGVTGDGIYYRRMEMPQALDIAERQVARLKALPTILDAWLERANHSPQKRIVCWIPGTGKSTDRMHQMFQEQEMGKAEGEGASYQFSRTAFPGMVLCYNPKTRRSYRIVRAEKAGDVLYTCQCPRFKNAQVCKHVLAAILHGAFEATETPMPQGWSEAEFYDRRLADFD